jgi:hypothetical protein
MVILSSAAQAALPRQLSKAIALKQVDRAAPEKESRPGEASGAADAHRARLLTEAAVALGATRLAAITPYFLAAGPGEVAHYFEQVAKAAPGCEVYAYLFPERTGVTVRPRQLARIAARAGLAGGEAERLRGRRPDRVRGGRARRVPRLLRQRP